MVKLTEEQQATNAAGVAAALEAARGASSPASSAPSEHELERARAALRQREDEARARVAASAATWSAEQAARAQAAGLPGWAVEALKAPRPPARPKPSRAAKRSQYARSIKERERLERFEKESERRGCPDFAPKDLEHGTRELANRVKRTSASAARHLRRMKRIAPAFAACVEIAAYAMVRMPDGTRRPTRNLTCRRARRVVAIAAVMLHVSDESKHTAYLRVVEGYARGTLCELFTNDDGEDAVSIGTLFATMTDGDRFGKWDCGAVVALERAGAIDKWQPSARSQIRAGMRCNVGKGRDGKPRALNQYWLRPEAFSADPDAGELLEERAEREWVRWLTSRARRSLERSTGRARPPP